MNEFISKLKTKFATKQKRSRVGPIGLHFANDQAHAVQLRRLNSGKYLLRAWASLDYPNGLEEVLSNADNMQDFISSLIGKIRFRGNKVVTAMPPELTRITSIGYQKSSGKSDDQQIIDLLSKRLSGDISDYLIDYLPVRSDDADREKLVLVASCKKTAAIDFLEKLRGARLNVTELEISPAAINRLVGQLPGSSSRSENVLVINYGFEKSYLTLISGRRLLMDKEVDFGARHLIDEISRGLDIEAAMAEEFVCREGLVHYTSRRPDSLTESTGENVNPVIEFVRPSFSKLADELQRTSRYAASISRGDGLERVYTFGTIARWPGADQLLSEIARIPVASTLPLTAIFDGEATSSMADYVGIGPDLAIATGLALRGLTEDA